MSIMRINWNVTVAYFNADDYTLVYREIFASPSCKLQGTLSPKPRKWSQKKTIYEIIIILIFCYIPSRSYFIQISTRYQTMLNNYQIIRFINHSKHYKSVPEIEYEATTGTTWRI